jgi:hypothetical protein
MRFAFFTHFAVFTRFAFFTRFALVALVGLARTHRHAKRGNALEVERLGDMGPKDAGQPRGSPVGRRPGRLGVPRGQRDDDVSPAHVGREVDAHDIGADEQIVEHFVSEQPRELFGEDALEADGTKTGRRGVVARTRAAAPAARTLVEIHRMSFPLKFL